MNSSLLASLSKKFEIVKLLGEGSFGKAFLAKYKATNVK